MRTTDTASRPNLARLSREDRIDIAVAEARGAAWQWIPGQFYAWCLVSPAATPLCYVGVLSEDPWAKRRRPPPPFRNEALPNITSTPAAWGALMEEEGVWPEPLFDTGGSIVGWWGRYRESHGGNMDIYPWTAQGAKPGIACALAFLAKHGITIPE